MSVPAAIGSGFGGRDNGADCSIGLAQRLDSGRRKS